MRKLVIDLFSGSKSVTNVLEKSNYDIISLDILKNTNPTIIGDILSADIIDRLKKEINGREVFAIWASPPCEKWSLGCGVKGGNIYFESIKDKKKKVIDIKIRENFFKTQYKLTQQPEMVRVAAHMHMAILEKTIHTIKELNPQYYAIENPFGYMRFYLKRYDNIIQNFATYCQYGFQYRKPTNIFSNVELNLKSCKIGGECHSNNFYNRGKENKITNIKSVCNSYLERSSIPKNLIIDVFNQFEQKSGR